MKVKYTGDKPAVLFQNNVFVKDAETEVSQDIFDKLKNYVGFEAVEEKKPVKKKKVKAKK